MNDRDLDLLRQLGDEPADRLIARLGPDVWAVNAALRAPRRNADPVPDSLPEPVRRFLAPGCAPTWWDASRVLRAQRWAQKHLFPITVSLFCASLPAAYAAEKGARVLWSTGRMRGDLDRRVGETARFVLDVLTPGAFEGNGNALAVVTKVRLMHAAIRGMLLRERSGFDEVPINQEDLLGMLFGFSVLITRSLTRLGLQIEAREAEDYYHLWRGVGALLGVRETALPLDAHAAREVMDQIALRHVRTSEHGRALTATLLARMEQHFDLPGLRAAPRALIHYLLGERTAEVVGVTAAPTTPLERLTLRGLYRHEQPGLGRYATKLFGQRLLDALVTVKLAGQPAEFAMPLEFPRP